MPRPRPLIREQADFRDDRLFLIACDDTHAPEQYFSFFRLNKVKIHVVPTLDGKSSSQHVLDRLCEIDHLPHDERWILLDTDHYVKPGHVATFRRTLKEAGQKGINVALSRPCFEIWLLLHHVAEATTTHFTDARQVVSALNTALGGYNKIKLREANYSEAGLVEACHRATRLDASVAGGVIPSSATTRVQKLWREILNSVPSHMLSTGLRELKLLENWG